MNQRKWRISHRNYEIDAPYISHNDAEVMLQLNLVIIVICAIEFKRGGQCKDSSRIERFESSPIDVPMKL